jgi:hypothetical protein
VKAYWGSKGIAPHILDLGTTWRKLFNNFSTDYVMKSQAKNGQFLNFNCVKNRSYINKTDTNILRSVDL